MSLRVNGNLSCAAPESILHNISWCLAQQYGQTWATTEHCFRFDATIAAELFDEPTWFQQALFHQMDEPILRRYSICPRKGSIQPNLGMEANFGHFHPRHHLLDTYHFAKPTLP